MLVLSRKEQEAIRVGDDIVIRIVKTGRRTVKIGIDAPDHLRVAREELAARLSRESLIESMPAAIESGRAPQFVKCT